MEAPKSIHEAVERFEHADPNHPPSQGFGTPLVTGIVAYSVILTIAVAAYVIVSAIT